jgi:osmotically inducible protein OsmC
MDILRTADAVWEGDLARGKGQVSTQSGVLKDNAYSFKTRFENTPGTNPEELIAAAQAACFSMALSANLANANMNPQRIATHATLTMEQDQAGFTITKMRLEVTGSVPGMDQATFQRYAEEAEQGCPIGRLLRPGLKQVDVVAKLE